MRRRRVYPRERSPLYQLRSKESLCSILGISRQQLSLLQSDTSYRVFPKVVNGKTRTIQKPLGRLWDVHKRLQKLMARIECPEWCFSGVRGRSHIDHARRHAEGSYLLACDIRGFYPSTQKEYVFRFFHYSMCQAENIAWMIADMATCEGHLPTGSPSSPVLAFWAYEPMFSEIATLADRSDARFTVYVDDMVISSAAPLPPGLLREISRIVRRYGLTLKQSKTRLRGPASWKKVTGAIITPTGRVVVPNKLRRNINELSTKLRTRGLLPEEIRRLHGLLTEAQQISKEIGSTLMPYVCELLRVTSD